MNIREIYKSIIPYIKAYLPKSSISGSYDDLTDHPDLRHVGIKTYIEIQEQITIPEHHDYNTYTLDVDGIVNLEGQINLFLSEFDGGGA